MTLEDYFYLLEEKSYTGKFPSVDKYGGCRYRGQNGTACGLGIIIPDDKYREEFEGDSVFAVLRNYPELLVDVTPSDFNSVDSTSRSDNLQCFLRAVQRAHDSIANQWVHATFMNALRRIPEFKEMVPKYSLS